MPAFVVATMEVHDEAAYMERYVSRVRRTIFDHGGALLATMRAEILEGKRFSPHTVILGFPDMDTALGWYRSPEYQEILPFRLAATTGSAIAVDGTGEAFTPGSGYIVATMEMLDPDTHATKYAPTALAPIAQHNGKILVRGGATEVLEGDAFGSRTVMTEFATMDAALAWYHSPAYQAVVPIRQAATDGSMIAVGGLPA